MNREDVIAYLKCINESVSECEGERHSCLVDEIESGAKPIYLNIWDVREEETELLVKEVLQDSLITCGGFWDDGKFEILADCALIPLKEIRLIECTY